MRRRKWTTIRFMSGMYALLATASTWAGSLAFVPSFVASAGNYPTGIVTADFNQDGKLDVAVAHDLNPTLSVLLASQNGDFGPAVSYPTDNVNDQRIAQSLVAADFNRDGILDLAPPNQYGGPFHVSVLLGNRDGTFQAQTLFQVGICPVAIAAADLNGDGVPDAYWDRLVQVRRMDNNKRIDEPDWKHTYSWCGSTWYWAVREGQGQVGWPGNP